MSHIPSRPSKLQVSHSKLSPREVVFVKEFVRSGIASHSAFKAGVNTPKSANTWASRALLRPRVANEVVRLRELVRKELARQIAVDLRKLMKKQDLIHARQLLRKLKLLRVEEFDGQGS